MPRSVITYGVGLGALATALVLRWLLDPVLGETVPFITIFGAVAIAAWVGGVGPGVVVTIGGFLVCAYFFIEPRWAFNLGDQRLQVALAAYLFTCAIIIGLCVAMRRARQLAEREHETLRVTFDSIGDAVISTDADGNVVSLNPVAEGLTGWARQSAVGRPLTDVFRIISEQTRTAAENPAERALRDGVISGLANHTLLVRKDGSEYPIDDSAAPIRNSDGAIVGCVLTFRDISERRALERRVAEQATGTQFLAAIVRSSRDAIVSKDLEGMVRSWNAAAERMFGYTAAEAIGRHIGFLIPRDRLPEEQHIIERMRAGERIDNLDTLRVKAGGETLHVSLTVSPIEDEHGQVVGISKIARDNTERVLAQAALQSRNERLRLLSEAAVVLLSETEPAAMLDGLLQKFGPFLGLDAYLNYMVEPENAAMRLVACSGFPDSAMAELRHLRLGAGICGVVAQNRAAIYRANIQQSDDPSLQHVRSFGFRLYVCNPLLSDGELLGTLSFASRSRDTLDPGELEFLATVSNYAGAAYGRLRLLTKLRQADQRKDEFLATLAHELRNPLAPLANAFEVMKRSDGDPSIMSALRQTVERQLGQLVRLVDDLLDVSRITRNVVALRRRPVNLTAVLQDAMDTCLPLAASAGVRLDYAAPEGDIVLNADAVRLTQVFANLLNNACKYTANGRQVQIRTQRNGDTVRVSVRDSGVGIARDKLGGIFEMFFQVENADSNPHGGLGIGLTLARRLTELHGGTIEAFSEGVGRGSEFVVTLPVVDANAQRDDLHTETGLTTGLTPDAGRGGRRVLVVDDNADSAKSLAMLLAIVGHETEVAHDGHAATEAAQRFRPQVVLLDIGMPGLNGYDTCRRLRETWGGALTIVAVTGWGQEAERARSRAAGFDYHLVKPIDYSDLDRILREVAV